jgi:hypothetical protein
MSFDLLGELNWLAVIVATIVYFALGAVWYTVPAMSKAWMRATGIQVPERRPGPRFGDLCGAAGDRVRRFAGHGNARTGHQVGNLC